MLSVDAKENTKRKKYRLTDIIQNQICVFCFSFSKCLNSLIPEIELKYF